MFDKPDPGVAERPGIRRPLKIDPGLRGSGIGCLLLFLSVWLAGWTFGVVAMVGQIARSIAVGEPDFCMMAFSLPFLAAEIGVGLFYLFLIAALFTPRPSVWADRERAVPGEVVHFDWRFERGAGRVRTLTITLEGAEETERRVGTRTTVDTKVFHTTEILDTTFPERIESGSAKVGIPPDAVPSMTAESNRLVWRLRFQGSCGWIPGVNAAYTITVLPAEPGPERSDKA